MAGHWNISRAPDDDDRSVEVTTRSLMGLFEQYVKLSRKIPPELLTTLAGIEDASPAWQIPLPRTLGIRNEDKQQILETAPVLERMSD